MTADLVLWVGITAVAVACVGVMVRDEVAYRREMRSVREEFQQDPFRSVSASRAPAGVSARPSLQRPRSGVDAGEFSVSRRERRLDWLNDYHRGEE